MRILLSLAATAAAVCIGTVANATAFVGTFDVTANQGSGLIINTAPDNGPVSFNLTQGNSTTVDLFDIWTPETAVNPDDLVAQPISVAFNFTLPTGFGGSAGGSTDTNIVLGIFDQGAVNWTNPTTLNFGNGGVLQISLSNETFNTGFLSFTPGQHNGADVYATFKLVHDSLPGVPEPASWALMIGGFGMAGAALRRRRQAVAA
ncbi:PEPxxWA-CTERM sorting domain-containing protein [Phenylobacterium sp.]|uniref:PEPxxWA-CTERM sorting domain-containing protein n=1 Tax=Phenylobacterium sp. TaxID=1871053 RepID=UPI00356726B9